MSAFYSNIYINNLNPFPVNLSVSFPGNAIETGDWALSQTSLAAFDPNAPGLTVVLTEQIPPAKSVQGQQQFPTVLRRHG